MARRSVPMPTLGPKPPRRWLRVPLRLAFGGVVLAALLAAAGAVYETFAGRAATKAYPPPGRLVDVGGHKLHLFCQGESKPGEPTVVLEGGAFSASSAWSWIQPELAKRYRACAYDRAGLAWSEPGTAPPDAEHVAKQLHTLLERAGVKGPYVLAGHSLGGLFARVFTARYPDEVTAVVFIDAGHPDQMERFPEEARQQAARMEKAMDLMPTLARLGAIRISGMMTSQAKGLPAQAAEASAALLSSPAHLGAAVRERLSWPEIAAQTRAVGSLGDKPLLVITAGKVEPVSLAEVWKALSLELAALSTRSTYEVVEGANHMSLLTDAGHAQRVADAIIERIDSALVPEPVPAAPAIEGTAEGTAP
ncbi:MAG TPA: alpha/beta fold hydrolase [Longimicrobium sp.]|nr:alpha/beta fold hydrolase [Longimicrobium sp.]